MNKARLEVEKMIYRVMDILDPDGDNSEFWKEEFAKMNDTQFVNYFTNNNMPLYFQSKAFKEPSIDQIVKGLDEIDVPLLERVYLPYKYKDKNGNPLKTQECLVVYITMKRMKQILTKKNSMSIDSSVRDMKTGLLTGISKNGKESDKEFESLAVSGLTATMKELSRSRADSMNDKSVMNSTIKILGQVSLEDLPDDIDDSISKNLLSTYFIGAQLYTNLVNEEYLTPYTRKLKNKRVDRID